MRRLAPFLVPLALAACAPEPVGPLAPIAKEQVTPAPALEASAARRAVVAFVHAYAHSARVGVGPLVDLVAGNELLAWVRWLGVQHREFTGTVEATADIHDVEFVSTVQAGRANGAQVALAASVTFDFAPEGADPFQRTRFLDGPVTLVRTDDGRFRVIDLVRDGVPMSDAIQLFRNERRTEGDLTVTLDSLFMFPPNWQFNVVVENRGDRTAFLDLEGVALFVRQDDAFERLGGVITRSLAGVPAGGTVDGILAYPSQGSADGRVLTLVYGGGDEALRFEFPLDDLVRAIPPPPPTGQAPVTEAAG
ncbi:MAG TPA: hypothetical protein VE669_06140 [Actinomycetota bacterium]|nr:hypothetical protein [Actinomycetota bacterium]